MALQLAKLAGLRVICVADVVRHGARLVDLHADVLVDRKDPARAIETIRAVTKGRLRFALDIVGKETAAHLQESLQRSSENGMAHLVGMTGLPDVVLPAVKHHSVPIKVLHSVPLLGDATMQWLEELLITKTLQPPEISIANGGLEGINEALDTLKGGSLSGKRIVVPIGTERTTVTGEESPSNGIDSTTQEPGTLEYAEKLNEDPSRVKFA